MAQTKTPKMWLALVGGAVGALGLVFVIASAEFQVPIGGTPFGDSLNRTSIFAPTISTMVARLSTPSGRLFFSFNLVSGVLLLTSGVIARTQFRSALFTEHPSAWGYVLHGIVVTGLIIVGTVPTVTSWNFASQQERVMSVVHLAGAFCCFAVHPVCEWIRCWSSKPWATQPVTHNVRMQRTRLAFSILAVLCFVVFFVLIFFVFDESNYREDINKVTFSVELCTAAFAVIDIMLIAIDFFVSKPSQLVPTV